MQGVERPDGLFHVSQIAPGLVPSAGVYGFLAEHRQELFPEESFADLFPSGRGRPSIQASVMATALLLQALEGRSDREAADALTFDLRWKAACGIPVDTAAFHFSGFGFWRQKIAGSARPDRIGEAINKVVERCGVLQGKRFRAVDSTVLDDAVARQDSVTLLVWQIRKVARLIPELADWIAGLPGGRWYGEAGKPDVDWDDDQARDRLVSTLVEDALAVTTRAGEIDGLAVGQNEAVALLALLAGQDVEPAEGSDGTDGRWKIARKVAQDRVISTVDPDARHARKTRSQKRDGFKAHVEVEPETGLVTGAKLTRAAGPGTSDGEVGAELIGQDPHVREGDADQILGDSAYASEAMFTACEQVKVTPVIKPHPVQPAVPDGFTVDDFTVDEQTHKVTCPAGQTRRIPAKGQVIFHGCGECPLKQQCTTAAGCRSIHITEAHLRQRHHRQRVAQAGAGFTVPYRGKRPMVERSLAWVTRGARRVPYRGVAKNDAWFKLRVAAVNLKRLTVMGLRRTAGTWNLAPAVG